MITARPSKHRNKPTVYKEMALLIPAFPLLISNLPRSIPFPAFCSSSKHPIKRLVESQNTLPLHHIISLICLGSDSTPIRKLLQRSSPSMMYFTPGYWSWASPEKTLEWASTQCAFSWVLNLIPVCLPLCLCSFGLWWTCGCPQVSLDGLGPSMTRYLGFLTYIQNSVLLQGSFEQIITHDISFTNNFTYYLYELG